MHTTRVPQRGRFWGQRALSCAFLTLSAPVALASNTLPFAAAVANPVPAEKYFTFQDTKITESSGLAMLSGRALTVNDSGDGPYVYVVDPGSGKTVGRMTFHKKKPRDVEALATDAQGQVWVADIGDNSARRKNISAWLISEPELVGKQVVAATKYTFEYPDKAQDAEAFAIAPDTGRVVLITKGVLGGNMYQGPETLSEKKPNKLAAVAGMPGLVTDAAFSTDGTLLFVRTYASIYTYTWPELQRLSRRQLPSQKQGETIAVRADGTVLIGSEGKKSDVLALTPTSPWGKNLLLGGGGSTAPDPGEAAPATPVVTSSGIGQAGSLFEPPAWVGELSRWWPAAAGGLAAVLIAAVWAARPRKP